MMKVMKTRTVPKMMTRAEKRRKIAYENWRLPESVTREILLFVPLRERLLNLTLLNGTFNELVKQSKENKESIELRGTWKLGMKHIRLFQTVILASGFKKALPSAITRAQTVVLEKPHVFYDTIDIREFDKNIVATRLLIFNLPMINFGYLDAPNLRELVITGINRPFTINDILHLSNLETICISNTIANKEKENWAVFDKNSIFREYSYGYWASVSFSISLLPFFPRLKDLIAVIECDISVDEMEERPNLESLFLLNSSLMQVDMEIFKKLPKLSKLYLRDEDAIQYPERLPESITEIYIYGKPSSRWDSKKVKTVTPFSYRPWTY